MKLIELARLKQTNDKNIIIKFYPPWFFLIIGTQWNSSLYSEMFLFLRKFQEKLFYELNKIIWTFMNEFCNPVLWEKVS